MNLKAIEGSYRRSVRADTQLVYCFPEQIKSFQKSQVFVGNVSIPIGEKYAEDLGRGTLFRNVNNAAFILQ